MFYLVCYDVVDDKRRSKISQALEMYGMRVQQSVFECVLENDNFNLLSQKLKKIINKREDQVRFYPLNSVCRAKVTILGIQPFVSVDDTAFIL